MANRFAVSLLSRENKNISLPEEVMIHKSTGQILNKTISGDIISFDKLARIKNHVDTTNIICLNLDINGDMYTLDLGDDELPVMVTYGLNLLSTPVIIHENKNLARTLLSIDLDCIELSNLTSLNGFEPNAIITFELKHDVDNHVVSHILDVPISELNNIITEFNQHINADENLEDFIISLVSIVLNKNILDVNEKNASILYNILIINE